MRERIGERYRIDGPLGRGGMGTVVAATDLETGRPVAVKWLGEPGASPGDRALARFAQEARIAGALASPHVARVADVGRDGASGVPYLVMELLPGEDLQALLDRIGALPVATAVRVARQACAGLAAAHAAGVVHRDVKPSNLFLTRVGGGEVMVKVVDFGIAKIRRAFAGAAGVTGALRPPTVSVTRSGEILGSPLYMSPEQIDAFRHVDARSDVFSMGVALHAMLVGRAPYAHLRSLVQLLYTVLNVPPPPLSSAAPWVPAEVAAVVDRAMAHAPGDRFADAHAMLRALQACAPEEGPLREEMLVAGEVGPYVPAPVDAGAPAVPSEASSLWRRFRASWG